MKRYIKWILVLMSIVLINFIAIKFINTTFNGVYKMSFDICAEKESAYQVFYSNNGVFGEKNSVQDIYYNKGNTQSIKLSIPKNMKIIRIDTGDKAQIMSISNIKIKYFWITDMIKIEALDNVLEMNDIEYIKINDENATIVSKGVDPYIIINLDSLNLKNIYKLDKNINMLLKTILCIFIDILVVFLVRKRRTIRKISKDIFNSRQIMWNLAKSDFKTKYAGSYLGIIWAFIHPVITVAIYWFVFQVGFKSSPIENFPFVLWLVSGMVPWFFFNESLINSTNSMIEYSYLVKKVVFKISILPIIKSISALFVHVFFVAFTFCLFLIYGYRPNIYSVQVVYYSLCILILSLSLSYITSSIIVFFKDLGQIIAIFLQIGMWMTPIMWSYTMVPYRYQWILKMNPIYYIVEGYRDSFINHIWFWHKGIETIYFWSITIIIFIIGISVFRKLKTHFADVL